MKKILLLATNQTAIPYPVAPLGPALLYHCLKNQYQAEFIDGFSLNKEELAAKLRFFQPDYIGVSIRNIDDMVKDKPQSFIPLIQERFINTIKETTNSVLILGGSGFSIFPDELIDLFQADYGIVGEAETSLPLLLEALARDIDPCSIKGVISRKHPFTTNRPGLDLTHYNHAQLDTILDYSAYRERGAYPIQTKRGCSHSCIYCSYPFLEGRRFRKRRIVDVVDEIEEACERIRDRGLVFEFVDSTFNDPPGHAESICREIIARGLSLNLRTMGMNPANITGDLLKLMQQAGFTQIDATPDSASEAMLRNYGKNFSKKQLIKAAECIRKQQMPTMWFFIFGGPGETGATIEESFHFIDDHIHKDDMVLITEGVRIYPNTALAGLAIKEGIITKDESLLQPRFYVSSHLQNTLTEVVGKKLHNRPNCIRISETKPPPELLQAAMKEREENNLSEPIFRTLLRLKRQMGY